MAQLPSDTVYKDIKEKGLQLTPASKIVVPEPSPMKVGLVKKLSSLVQRKKQQNKDIAMIVYQIHNNAFLAIKKHSVFIYKYSYDETQRTVNIQGMGEKALTYEIQSVFSCQIQYIQDRDYPLLFKFKMGLSYLNFDLKECTLTQRSVIKFSNVIGVGWISDKECLVLDGNNIIHNTVVQQQLKQKSSIVANLLVDKDEQIQKTWILGHVDEQQDSTIVIFYGTVPREQNKDVKYPPMKLKIKQFVRTLDGDIIEASAPDFTIETKNLEYRDKFTIISVGQYYCLQLATQILILKKKFDKYMLMDNMVQKLNGFQIKLYKKGLMVSLGQKMLELSWIQFSDPKCTSKILDVIEFPQQLLTYNKFFRQLWPIMNPKQYTLIFVFINENQILLSGLVKLEPMQKMLTLATNSPKDKLQIIQDMALNLGIAKKDFYLKLWSSSKKQNSHIYQYLLPCKDVTSIKKQLKSTLRTRTIQVSEMLKILQKITQINLQNLKKDLNHKHLKQYVKNDFLRRKIKLNEVNIKLDHRIFQNIYSSSLLNIFFDIVSEQLDPIQPKFDPLHTNLNYQPIKQLKSLENVFQEFKVIILEDYKTFLREFLKKFQKKITQVLYRFNFLLPNYPFQIEVQKPSKTNEPIVLEPSVNGTPQQLWFQTVTLNEWQGEVTKQKILKQLFNDYPTSKITQTIDEFYSSMYGQQNKRWKHGLITANLEEYTTKVKTLNGLQLYLNVCEFANELSVENDGDPNISMKIINILRQKNGLAEPDIHYCKLYASMHYFMLKNKIMPKNKLDITTLTNLQPQNLIAIFLLENKQRKEHIFADFKNLYEDKNQFREVLQKFIESQNCSRIELQILMEQIIEKGYQFQQQNQDLIELLITGICMKVEIRECLLILDVDDEDQQSGGCLIDKIKLSKNLALKINRVIQLRKCKSIFKCFNLQRMTYKQLLDLELDNQIFKLVLTKYFQQRDDESRLTEPFEVEIQDEIINLQNPRNLLTVLVYLQETVYYSANPFQILLIFGIQLILWKQFQVMRELINDQNALQTLGVKKDDFLQHFLIRGLQTIYLDQEIIYDDETKEQIINILSIDDQMSPLKIRQIAKLDLVDIFTNWGLEVHPSDIYIICQKWKNQNRDEFMVDLIDNYADNLDFKSFQQIYRLLEITDKQTTQINHLNKQYVKFCDCYAKKLLEKHRYKEVIEIITFLMNIPDEKIQYSMLVEAYIKMVVELCSEDEDRGRAFLQFFVQKYDTAEQYSIKQLLESFFDDAVLGLWDRAPTIQINYRFHFSENKKTKTEVSFDDLWQIAKCQAQDSQQLFYNYFFLMIILNNPKRGLAQTVGISYNLEKITNLLVGQLQNFFDRNQNLWFVNYTMIEAKFLFDAMLGQAANSLNININFKKDPREKLQMIIKQLGAKKSEKNDKILSLLKKLKAQVSNKNKRIMKQEKYQKKLKQLTDKQLQENKEEQAHVQSVVQQESKPQVFLTWKMVAEEKRIISSNSQYLMSQKDLIDQVFESNYDSAAKIQLPQKAKPKKANMFQNLFIPIRGIQKVSAVVELLHNKNYKEAGTHPRNIVIQAIQKLFAQEPQRNYTQIIDILDEMDFGDPQKRALFKVAKYFIEPLSNEIKKQLFNLDFLMRPIGYSGKVNQDKYSLIYQEMRPKIQQIIQKISSAELKQLAGLMGMILESNEYSAKVYLDTLIYIGHHGIFDSATVLMAQQCIDGMGDFPELVATNYEEILNNMIFEKQMKLYVRENLTKLMSEKNYDDIVELIKNYKID